MSGKTWIFDYDDTLAPNQHDYSVAQIEFVKFVIDRIGMRAPTVKDILEVEIGIDCAAVETMGFGKERFPTSCREAYRTICNTLGVEVLARDLHEAYCIGKLAFDPVRWKKNGLVEGAQATLDTLRMRGDKLILLTKGDKEIQNMKLSATNMAMYFDIEDMHIVDGKSAESLLDLVKGKDLSKVWHVGNSIRSDVNLGLEAGMGVVYIPCETWAYEQQHNGLPDNPRLKVFDNIGEIVTRYDEF